MMAAGVRAAVRARAFAPNLTERDIMAIDGGFLSSFFFFYQFVSSFLSIEIFILKAI